MERIMYRKTLDVHKNGIQFMLQGFETADNMSRVIEISLMASGDAIDFPLENVEAIMYVTTPSASEPSINKCTIKDNKVVYEVLPIVEEGITNMQLKIIETSTDGATGILASPKFAVEVTKSDADDGNAEQTTTFTALEDAMAKAKAVYDERFLRMELSSDCVFRAYYADGTIYETDVLQKLFLNGNVLLSESFAHGGTGIRAGEDTDNSKYYSNVSKSEALKAKSIMENSEELLEEVKLHGVYTAFKVDFESGEVEYVSPSYKFKINLDTGELDAEGQANTYTEEIVRVVTEWFSSNKIKLDDLQNHAIQLKSHSEDIKTLKEVTPILRGGTGATTAEKALTNLGAAAIDLSNIPFDVLKNIDKHYWKRQEVDFTIDVASSDNTIYVYDTSNATTNRTIYYADNVSAVIDDSNVVKVILNNPTKLTYNWDGGGTASTRTPVDVIAGKYWSEASDGSKLVYYTETLNKVVNNVSGRYYTTVSGAIVSASTTLSADVEYVYGENENSYQEGIIADYLYTYMGIPERNILSPMQIQSGSYVGTGTFGIANPNSLVFGFEPKVVLIYCSSGYLTTIFPWTGRGLVKMSGSQAAIIVSIANNTLSWYSGQNQYDQLNSEGIEYWYTAIG